jgi:fused signal recognition particle receptor
MKFLASLGDRLRDGLGKTRAAFEEGFARIFQGQELEPATVEDLEALLLQADLGLDTAERFVERVREQSRQGRLTDGDARRALGAHLREALAGAGAPLDIDARPAIVVVVGVNGSGKTTTCGKLAARLRQEGHSVLLGAGDTFRAAAIEQLATWGGRNGVPVIAQGPGADSASVIFDALQTARSRGADVLIADTAGRLHTQSGLMDELSKIRRVLGKLDTEAPHEVLLVIDGTTGQNAISQTRQFREAIGVSGLVVTKLDGTAKGGVVFALAREFGLPIRYVGLGESAEDLRVFDAQAFVDGLLPATLGTDA